MRNCAVIAVAVAFLTGAAGGDSVAVWDRSPTLTRGEAQRHVRVQLSRHGTPSAEAWTVLQVIASRRGTIVLLDDRGRIHRPETPCGWWRQFERGGAWAFFNLDPDHVRGGTFTFEDSTRLELERSGANR